MKLLYKGARKFQFKGYFGYWAGRMAARNATNKLKDLDEEHKKVQEAIKNFDIAGIEKGMQKELKDLMSAEWSAHRYFTLITVKRDEYFKVLEKTQSTTTSRLKKLKKVLGEHEFVEDVTFFKNHLHNVKEHVKTRVWSEYKDLLNLVKSSQKDKDVLIAKVKDMWKKENASYGKYFLMRYNLRKAHKDFKESEKGAKKIAKILESINKLASKKDKKSGEEFQKKLKEFKPAVDQFFKVLEEGLFQIFKGIKRDLLYMFAMQEDIDQSLITINDIERREIIPPAMAQELTGEFKSADAHLKELEKLEGEQERVEWNWISGMKEK